MAAPVIEFRSDTNPFGVLASLTLQGGGAGFAVVAGTTSFTANVRIYNNFAAAGSIHDAVNCVLAAYDNNSNQGSATTPAVQQVWLQVEVLSYNGTTTNADTQYFSIGGASKHAVPVNSGTISGTGSNYVQVSVRVVVLALAAGSLTNQGLWLEYSFT